MEEMQVNDVLAIWELRGSYPDVPYAPHVQIEELTAGDDDPLFVTLPIGVDNVRSKNKKFYSAEVVTEILNQTIAERPVGVMGHIPASERSHAFPPEAVHWVGATRQGNYVWGKAYMPPGPARDRMRRYKATGKRIATSIDATGKGRYDKKIDAYVIDASTFKLNQIDIAPADRAGVPELSAVPVLSQEMEGNDPETPTEENPMDLEQALREMTPDHASSIPEPVRTHLIESSDPHKHMTKLMELLGTKHMDDVEDRVTELVNVEQQRGQEQVTQKITELLNDEEKGVKFPAVRPLIQELIMARDPKTPEQAEVAFNEVVASENVKNLLQETLKQQTGPKQRVPLQVNGDDALFDIPDIDEED